MGSPYRTLSKVLISILVAVFSILLLGGWLIFENEAPRPTKVVDENGKTLISKAELISGQAIYEKYGLTDYGSYLGNGSYLGPDYTAETLHQYIQGMHHYYAQTLHHKSFKNLTQMQQAGIEDKVRKEIRINRYSKTKDELVLTDAQVAGLKHVRQFYQKEFVNNPKQAGLPQNMIDQFTIDDYMVKGNKIEHLSDFFFWGAWLSSTDRPDRQFSYTNNWPYDAQAGNTMPSEALIWSAISVALLVAGVAIIIYFQRRYQFDMEATYKGEKHLPKIKIPETITSSQAKTAKYFVVVMILF